MKTWFITIAALTASGFAQAAPVWLAADSVLGRLSIPPQTAPAPAAPAPNSPIYRVFDARAVPGPDNTCDPDGLCLSVTVGRDTGADACADTTTVLAAKGDRVNFCYTVSNQSTTTTFQYHTAADDSVAPEQQFFVSQPVTLAPGETYRYNRIQALDRSVYATTTWSATAQLPAYTFDDSQPADFIDISTTGTRLDLQPGAVATVAMPFPAWLYGSPSRHLAVDTRGAIEFGSDYSPLPNFDGNPGILSIPWASAGTNGYQAELAPYRMLLGFGSVYTQTLGSAPDRRFIAQWTQMKPAVTGIASLEPVDTPKGVTFEVVLFENSTDILFQYQTTAFGDAAYDDGAIAAVGINYGVLPDFTAVGTAYSLATASLHDGLAIRWTPNATTTSQTSAFAGVQVDTPIVGIVPASLDLAAASAGSASGTVDIINQGIGRLDYHFAAEPAPVDAALPAFGLLGGIDLNTFLATDLRVSWFDASAPTPPPTALSPSLFTTSANSDIGLSAIAFVGDDFATLYQVGTDLTRIDTASGTQTIVGSTGLFERGRRPIMAAYDASTKTLYALASSILNSFGYLPSELYSIDIATGAAQYVGALIIDEPVFQIEAIAFSPSGELYGVRTLSSIDPGLSRLYRFERGSLQAHLVGPFALDYFPSTQVGLAFDQRDGSLYMTNNSDGTADGIADTFLFAIDPATADLQLLGPVNDPFATQAAFTALNGFALATRPDQDCVDVNTVPWLTVDPAAASLTSAGTAVVTVSAYAGGLADGIYTANLCLTTNDPRRRHEIVPVRLSVGDVDDVFANGFDGATP